MIEVVEPGMLTSVQDAGRPDWTPLGVPIGGACDAWSLAVANLLVGNPPGAAGLEITIAGPTLLARADTLVGLAGGGKDGGRAVRLGAGETLDLRAVVTDPRRTRAYVAVPGGIDVPEVLGSASTALAAGFGGLEGRALRAGDILRARAERPGARGGAAWPATGGEPEPGGESPPIRVLPGPAAGNGRLDEIVGMRWTVGAGSDRVGLRLEGSPVGPSTEEGLLSHGVTFGAIQVPPDGAPIVLLADCQTTGGYPVPAVVIAADRPRLGQLRPGSAVTFRQVSLDDARIALQRQRAGLERGATMLREADGWDELWQAAGG